MTDDIWNDMKRNKHVILMYYIENAQSLSSEIQRDPEEIVKQTKQANTEFIMYIGHRFKVFKKTFCWNANPNLNPFDRRTNSCNIKTDMKRK